MRSTEEFTANAEYGTEPYPDLRQRAFTGLRLVWKDRRLLMRFVCSGLILGVLVAFLVPTEYQSTTTLMPPENKSDFNPFQLTAQLAGLGALAGGMLGMKSPTAHLVGILQSRAIQQRLVNRFDLKKVYRTKYMIDACKKLEQNSTITMDKKSEIISVSVRDHDPKLAAQLAGAYVEELDTIVSQLNTSGAHRERVFLEDRLKSVKQELDSAAKDFSEFASKNTAIDIKEQGKAMLESAGMLQGELIAAQTELEGLRQAYSDNNIRVRSAKARVEELQHELTKLGGTNSISSSTGGEAQLYPSIRQLPLLGVRYSDLFRQTKVEGTVFELVSQQYELAKVQEAKDIPSVKVLDVAQIPEKKSFPPRTLFALFGILLGFGAGVSWLFLSRAWRSLDPHHPERLLVDEILGSFRNGWPRQKSRSATAISDPDLSSFVDKERRA